MTRTMQVTETCQQLGVAESTLKRWTERGLITASRHPINNSRQYAVAEVERVKRELARVVESADLTTAFRALTVSRGLTFADDLTEDTATAAPPAPVKHFKLADAATHLGISLALLTSLADQKAVSSTQIDGAAMIPEEELTRVKKVLASKDLASVLAPKPVRSQM
jgi:transposase-like protein